jgi:hypothetical protein
MKRAALKFSPVLFALFVGGCATTTTAPPAGVLKYEQVILKNPTTGQVISCRMRVNVSAPLNYRGIAEANQQACIRNAKRSGFTHELQVTKWP